MSTTRVTSLQALLSKHQLSHILITDPVDVTYISGFSSTNAALLISQRSKRLLTDFRYETAARVFCADNPQWKYHIIKTSMAELVASFLTERKRVGFQSNHFTVDKFKKLKHYARNVRFITINNKISDATQCKTPAEISAMEQAAAIGDRALSRLFTTLKPGITERECARLLERFCAEYGSEKPSFDTIVLFGANSALPHGHPCERKLKKGDTILIDFGCTLKGFSSDMTRTAFFGKASHRQKELYSLVLNAQKNACTHIRAGIKSYDADALARSVIESGGYGKEFGHALGHGVGRRVHETPRLSSHSKEILQENSVVTIEPGVYLPGFGGIRIEDMAVVHQHGARLLTNFPKELIEV